MASLYRKPCVESAYKDDGYVSDGLWNKYAERLDQCDFFAGCGKKNGAVDYCGIAYCYWLFLNVITDDGIVTDDDRKYMVHYAMYQSDSCCTSAGCTQQADVYKSHGAWSTNPKDLAVGYQVFFQKSNGTIYHTGMCVDWDDNGFTTMEANIDGRQTHTRYYRYSEIGGKVAGFGIPRFDGYEIESSEPDTPKPEPMPEPVYSDDMYRVTTNGGILRLRSAPNTKSAYLIGIPNGTKLKVDKIVTGESIEWDENWAHTSYGGYTGYVSCAWITKI